MRSKTVDRYLELGQLLAEKCELKKAEETYLKALHLAKKTKNLWAQMEALSGILRLANETLDDQVFRSAEKDLNSLMIKHPSTVPPMVWYCKGAIARFQNNPRLAQRNFYRYLRAIQKNHRKSSGEGEIFFEKALIKGWVALAVTFAHKGHLLRARWVGGALLKRFDIKSIRSMSGMIYLLFGNLAERQRNFEEAWKWYQKAHCQFLAEHHWYYYLYVLYGYARLSRLQQNYIQAYWYLDLLDHAVSQPVFCFLRREVAAERSRLEQDAVDLLIDSRRGLVKTREVVQISLRKQYVLLDILEALALTHAHDQMDQDGEQGLSKAEIIQKVWKEDYRPEAHDNKLYYNINRLRKLIEPDVHKPQYLLNWKEGYRFAPGLRVQLISAKNVRTKKERGNTHED